MVLTWLRVAVVSGRGDDRSGYVPDHAAPGFVRVASRTTLLEVAKGRMCGTWRLFDRIGGGGNGDVYRCRGTSEAADGMEAAVKILKRSKAARRDRIARFRNEVDFL